MHKYTVKYYKIYKAVSYNVAFLFQLGDIDFLHRKMQTGLSVLSKLRRPWKLENIMCNLKKK